MFEAYHRSVFRRTYHTTRVIFQKKKLGIKNNKKLNTFFFLNLYYAYVVNCLS